MGPFIQSEPVQRDLTNRATPAASWRPPKSATGRLFDVRSLCATISFRDQWNVCKMDRISRPGSEVESSVTEQRPLLDIGRCSAC